MQPASQGEIFIRKATIQDADAAFRIVKEYYEAAAVIARETKEEFRNYYFGERGGVWLASLKEPTSLRERVVGCIALRELSNLAHSAEIKRMYVQLAHRQHGIATMLLGALESFASGAGYDNLYLDSAPGMDTAINFYKRHGYSPCERYNDNPQANI